MTAAPVLEARKRSLTIAEPTLATLVAHAADPVHASLEGAQARDQLVLLQAAGIIRGGQAHPAIRDALTAIVRPHLCTLELEHSGRAIQGWAGYDGAALLLPPRADGTRRLLQVHPTLLPEALARLVDLGPRPRPEADAPVPFVEEAFTAIRRRWSLGVAWTIDGTPGGARLEVLDTDGGLWLLDPGDDEALTAVPVTASVVWRHVVRMLMRRSADPA